MSEHFVCTGECGGISEIPKDCEGENCSKKGQPMAPCGCGDGSHSEHEAAKMDDPESSESK